MKQLLKQDPVAMGMLGKQSVREQVYRPLTYVLTVEEMDKKIYFNLLTHEMIVLDHYDLEMPEARNYLIENWYLVPEEHDDQQLVDECRAVLTLMDSWPKKINTFHIFTTLDCNARCFYCFEKRLPGSDMTMETASRVIDYMQEEANGDLIRIVWFGGEPLFNYPIIDFIADGLRERGLQFESDVITNGLLFDKSLVKVAKNLWNVKKVQITIDGTRHVYRKVKAYVTDVKDPFERVLQNIKSLLKAGIKVHIRLNIGFHNYIDMQDLIDFLCEEFKEEELFFVYISPLFEIKEYTKDKKECMYEILDNLNSKLNMVFGKKKKREFDEKITNGYCMASGREAVTILPDGSIGICQNNTSDALIGNIYSKELNEKVREEFGRRFYQEDKCRTCPLYPNCYIVNGCPNKGSKEGCDSLIVQRRIESIKQKMQKRCRQSISLDETGFAYNMRKAKEQSSETEV